MIPWVLSDSNFVRTSSQRLDSSRTVFVGGLHGMINAGMLLNIYFFVKMHAVLSENYLHLVYNCICDYIPHSALAVSKLKFQLNSDEKTVIKWNQNLKKDSTTFYFWQANICFIQFFFRLL